MLSALWNFLFFIIVIGILVLVHECGHFFAARRCGVKVLRFSLGFGPVLFRKRGRDGTEYVISCLPVGGYVSMKGEAEDGLQHHEEEDRADEDRKTGSSKSEVIAECDFAILKTGSAESDAADDSDSLTAKSVGQRAFIIAAGPASNILLAFFLYFIVALTGITTIKPVAGDLIADRPVSAAGVASGDLILSVNGSDTGDWSEFFAAVVTGSGERVPLRVRSPDGAERDLTLDLRGVELRPDRNLMSDLGVFPYTGSFRPEVSVTGESAPAYAGGMRTGDVIMYINGMPAYNWSVVQSTVMSSKADDPPLMITVMRKGDQSEQDAERLELFRRDLERYPASVRLKELLRSGEASTFTVREFEVTPRIMQSPDGKEERAMIGVQAHLDFDESVRVERRYGVVDGLFHAAEKTLDAGALIFVTIGKMLTGTISVENISGPVGIAKSAGMSASIGVTSFILFMAVVSVNLGIANLLPVPVLDGGQLLFIAYEALTKRPPSERMRGVLLYAGAALLVMLMALSVLNDLRFL